VGGVAEVRSRTGEARGLPWFGPSPGDAQVQAAWRDAEPRPYWADTVTVPEPAPALEGRLDGDLVIIGGGFTGLWAALHAKEQSPEREVILLEAETCGYGGSGRNGGFCLSSLTHTLENGMARFQGEMPTIERLGFENHAALLSDVEEHRIDCEVERAGFLLVAVDDKQAEGFRSKVDLLRELGHDAEVLGPEETRAEVASPLYRGAVLQRSGTVLLNPMKLVLGLRDVALRLGVRLFEHTPATEIRDLGRTLRVYSPQGRVDAEKALLATNAFPPLVRELRRYVVPVYDYALTTERLSSEQLDAIGWNNRHAVEDAGNEFHYYRLTPGDRILWGGFGAVYGGRVNPAMEDRDEMFQKLVRNFFINAAVSQSSSALRSTGACATRPAIPV
jgi:glycine/D-amino acid oxidase-like deaminating enzyme